MRYLSLFSGIEAASCAWQPLEWELVGLSEIEKFPCNVLAHHYPHIPNLGDITKISDNDLKKLGSISLIVGGSPCQGFSVAGKQKGLNDVRSKLAIDYIRILHAIRPHWIVWENVPGVLSTNGGADFQRFVKEITDIGYGVCWRVLDAQYFGVAQRRRRVFLVGYLGDWRPAYKVLFESESLPGYLATLERTKERLTASAKGSSGKTGDCYDMNHPCDVIRTYEDGKTPTLEARMGTGGNNIPLVFGEGSFYQYKEVAAGSTLKAAGGALGGGSENFVIGMNHIAEKAESVIVGKMTTLTARQYKSPPIVLNDQGGSQMTVTEDKTATLRAQEHGHQPIVVQGSVIGRKTENGPQGSGINIDKCFTLNTTDRHAVCSQARVRKLTPTEYLRLQGFPDDWFEGVEGYSDTAAYKAIGNSMAVPCMKWIGERIALIDKEYNRA